MKTIEEVIDNIVDEHKECRWMDAGELREYLEVVAQEQKAIDDEENGKAMLYVADKTTQRVKKEIANKAYEWIIKKWDKHDCDALVALSRLRNVLEGTEQKAIENKRMEELLQYLEELEAHYRDLGQYDDGKPIRRVIAYIKSMEEIDMKKYDEEYLNSKIEAYGKAHPNGNKEDLALLAEMRGYDMED